MKLSLKKENLVTEFQLIEFHEHHTRIGSYASYWVAVGFDLLFCCNEVDLEKLDREHNDRVNSYFFFGLGNHELFL